MNQNNYSSDTQNLNNFCEKALLPDTWMEQQNKKLKPKAYINPQNINYEYIKSSLSRKRPLQANKIHVNPNFGKIANTVSLMQSKQKLPIKAKSSLYDVTTIFNGNNISQCSKSIVPLQNSSSKYIFVNQNNFKNVHEELYSWNRKANQIQKKFQIQLKEKDLDKPEMYKTIEESLIKSPKNINVKYKSKKSLATHCQNNVSNKICLINTSKKKINSHSTKTINNSLNYNKSYLNCEKINSFTRKSSHLSKFVSNKNKESVIKLASLVKNKYKYSRNGTLKSTVYKIDKRKKLVQNSDKNKFSEKSNHIRKVFPVAYDRSKFYSNLYFNSQCFHSIRQKNILSWRKNKKLEKLPKKKLHIYENKKIVKIGGIIYKSTSNKLTIANQKNTDGLASNVANNNVGSNVANKKKSKARNCLIVYVRGEKFLLGKNGKTLKRQNEGTNSSHSSFKRIDLGGVTYLQKSQNVLIRTNLHLARDLVNQAKMKSIATLCHLRKKTSLPCMIYHKFGKCIRHCKGLCMYKHDPKNIAICKKFLKGECTDQNCLLSHEPIKEKMAECHFFINGSCNKDSCPFLHVKLNKNTDICKNFLQGFCTFGENCSKRHVFEHPNCNKFRTRSFRAKCSNKEKEKVSLEIKKKNENEEVKYYSKHSFTLNDKKETKKKRPSLLLNEKKKSVKKEKISKVKSTELTNNFLQIADTLECFPKKIKLDKLPAFIPLN